MSKASMIPRTSRGDGRIYTPQHRPGAVNPPVTSAISPQYSTRNKVTVAGLAALGLAGIAYWNYGGHSAARRRRLNNTD